MALPGDVLKRASLFLSVPCRVHDYSTCPIQVFSKMSCTRYTIEDAFFAYDGFIYSKGIAAAVELFNPNCPPGIVWFWKLQRNTSEFLNP